MSQQDRITQMMAEQTRELLFSIWVELREVRHNYGWTIEEAAEQVGVDTSTYQRWELGQHRPHLSNLRALLRAFASSKLDEKSVLHLLQFLEDLEEKRKEYLLAYLMETEEEDMKRFRHLLQKLLGPGDWIGVETTNLRDTWNEQSGRIRWQIMPKAEKTYDDV